ncbi:hypothetical protein ACFVZH_29530 [Streptomyces sp. NPDC059534]|uniref:hypothetical protein n=1 Tax=Streptomyces sp. NPDC059534 TaxID=3346859 RepID=UPI0036A92463
MTRSENEVDQIVFRWDSENPSGSTGFGPVAWSGPRDEVEGLFRISGPVLRATGDETRTALIRIQRGAGVMLIRRTPFVDAGGGTSVLCHALVGSSDLLTPATCLGLHAWDWEGAAAVRAAEARGRLPVIPEEALVRAATGRGQWELDRALPDAVGELIGVVAELLRHPTERFTVLDARGDTACPVLWGLHGMFGGSTNRRWTFATHDTAELTELRFVFVGRWSGAASRNTDRRRVDPRDRYGDRADAVATGLVRHHLRVLADGDGQEYAVASALHTAASARRAPLLDTAARALDTLDRRTGDLSDRPPAPTPRKPPPATAPRTPAPPAPGPDRRTAEPDRWDRRQPDPDGPDRRPPEADPPERRLSEPDRWDRRPADPDRPDPRQSEPDRSDRRQSESDRWDRRPAEPAEPDRTDRRLSESDRWDRRPADPDRPDPRQSEPDRTDHRQTESDRWDRRPAEPDRPDPRQSEPDRWDRQPAEPDRPARRPMDPDGPRRRPADPDRSDRRGADPYGDEPRTPREDPPYAPVPPPAPDRAPLTPDRDRAPLPPDRQTAAPISLGPEPVIPATPPTSATPPVAPPPPVTEPSVHPAPGAGFGSGGGDAYPRPVLPAALPEWTGPGKDRARPWGRARGKKGKGREREEGTGLVHKLPTARSAEEARELVERGGSRELLDVLRRPLEYPVLTVLLQEIGRRLPAWEHPLRRELCEVAVGLELWAVARPGDRGQPSEPSEEQRAANAAELYRWAVRPVLGGGDAPLGTVASLLSWLRTSPEPSARETFWLIVDGDRPGLPDGVWLTLLKEAYGLPRTPPRPGAPVSPAAVPPDDQGSGYTRRFLTRAALLLGGLVVAIVLIVVWGALT